MLAELRARLLSLVAVADTDVDEAEPSVLELGKAASGGGSPASMLTEISLLEAVRAIGVPAGLFADFDVRRTEHSQALRKPLDRRCPSTPCGEMRAERLTSCCGACFRSLESGGVITGR